MLSGLNDNGMRARLSLAALTLMIAFAALMPMGPAHARSLDQPTPIAEKTALDEDGGDQAAPVYKRKTYRTVCVRLCDGFYFPISFATTTDGFGRDEDACRSRCSSPSRLYFYPNPGGTPERMHDRSGRAYLNLETAFMFRLKYDVKCTCKPQPWSAEAAQRHAGYAKADENPDRLAAGKSRSAVAATSQSEPPVSQHDEIAAASAPPMPDQKPGTTPGPLRGDDGASQLSAMSDATQAGEDLTGITLPAPSALGAKFVKKTPKQPRLKVQRTAHDIFRSNLLRGHD